MNGNLENVEIKYKNKLAKRIVVDEKLLFTLIRTAYESVEPKKKGYLNQDEFYMALNKILYHFTGDEMSNEDYIGILQFIDPKSEDSIEYNVFAILVKDILFAIADKDD